MFSDSSLGQNIHRERERTNHLDLEPTNLLRQPTQDTVCASLVNSNFEGTMSAAINSSLLSALYCFMKESSQRRFAVPPLTSASQDPPSCIIICKENVCNIKIHAFLSKISNKYKRKHQKKQTKKPSQVEFKSNMHQFLGK